MNRILDWTEYDTYFNFTKHNIFESNQPDQITKKVRIKVDYAIRAIAGKFKFFAQLVYNLRIIYTRQIPTAAVDGTNMFINPDFLSDMTENQIKFIVCHEVMHCALLHFARMQGRDGERWNVAGDYEINLLLEGEGLLTYDEIATQLNGLIDRAYVGMSAEQLYNDPDLKMPEQQKPNKDNKDSDEESDSSKGSSSSGEGGSGGSGKEGLFAGNIIYDKANNIYGKVNSVNKTTGEVDYDPISKDQAETELKKLKA